MRNHHMLFCCALLGSALATVTAASGASSADQKRMLAAEGIHSSAFRSGRGAAFSAARLPSTYSDLHDFTGQPNDGSDPTAGVTLDSSGNIFGTTSQGGASSVGALFEVAKGGNETLLHSFGGSGDGYTPDGAVIFDAKGNMYGTTNLGGSSGGEGTIWELAANGTYSVLHSFDEATEGYFIRGRLVEDKKGNLYGTALFGGSGGYGSVFKYSSKGKLTILHAFDTTEGEDPEHGVVRDKAGNLYGVTAAGGTSEDGTLYEIAADGTFSTLHNFTGGSDGGFPYGGLALDKAGNLYGSTAQGGASNQGTVFMLAPNGTLTTLYNFSGGVDGGSPEGDMLLVGKNLYSTAIYGGDPNCQCGVVYEVTSKGAEKVLHNFVSSTGGAYSNGVVSSHQALYGTASSYGADGNGVVFSVTKK